MEPSMDPFMDALIIFFVSKGIHNTPTGDKPPRGLPQQAQMGGPGGRSPGAGLRMPASHQEVVQDFGPGEAITTTPWEKFYEFSRGGYAHPDPPIWACWGRPRGGYHPWGYSGSLLKRKND